MGRLMATRNTKLLLKKKKKKKKKPKHPALFFDRSDRKLIFTTIIF